jgi:hypothetical protein
MDCQRCGPGLAAMGWRRTSRQHQRGHRYRGPRPRVSRPRDLLASPRPRTRCCHELAALPLRSSQLPGTFRLFRRRQLMNQSYIRKKLYLAAPPAGFEPAQTAPETVPVHGALMYSDLRKRQECRRVRPLSIASLSRSSQVSAVPGRSWRSPFPGMPGRRGPSCRSCPTESSRFAPAARPPRSSPRWQLTAGLLSREAGRLAKCCVASRADSNTRSRGQLPHRGSAQRCLRVTAAGG